MEIDAIRFRPARTPEQMAAVHVGGYGADPPNGPNPANVQAVAIGCESLGPDAAAVAPAVTAATVADGCPGQGPCLEQGGLPHTPTSLRGAAPAVLADHALLTSRTTERGANTTASPPKHWHAPHH